ncbi:unnamed protein product [Meganyctiphanes norvegica]|uniref:ISXO2-like transposase domain-containing protein n=1 Tax=Meganyctiphanes norvegica TaxID=48144 RepID=A0AAV2Q5P5_MEGNR
MRKKIVVRFTMDNLSTSTAPSAAMNQNIPNSIEQHLSRQQQHHYQQPQFYGQQQSQFNEQEQQQYGSCDEILPLPILKTDEKASTISAPPVYTAINFENIPNNHNALLMTPVNLHKYSRYSPEPPNIYPPELAKNSKPENSEMHYPQSHRDLNSQCPKPKSYTQEKPPEFFKKFKIMESELKRKDEQKLSEHRDTMPGMNIENSFLNLQHSIFQNEVGITQECRCPDDSYIDNKDDSCSGEEMEKHKNCSKLSDKSPQNVWQETPFSNKVEHYTEKVPESEGDDIIVQLVDATTPIIDVIRWLQKNLLLKSEMKCDRCESYMTWKISNKTSQSWRDGFYWICKNGKCPTLNCRRNIRIGSIFDKSKLCLKDWLHIMYKWSRNVGQSAASSQMKISRCTIATCYSFFREVCVGYFNANPIKLGGPGIILEIDVFCLSPEYSKKQKRKSEPQPPIWVFIIMDTNCTPSIGYMEIIDTKDVVILLPIILKVVQSGSIIRSKEWMTYQKIQGILNTGGIVTHSVNFVNAINNDHEKQTIESYWQKHKSYLAAMRGTSRGNLKSYLQEFMWHERFSDNTLEIFCEQIALQYSDSSYIDISDRSSLEKEKKEQENNLEEPPHKKNSSIFQQDGHSIFQASTTKDLNASDASYIDNTDFPCLGEKIENHKYYLEGKLEENIDNVKELPLKKGHPGVQKKRRFSKKVKDNTKNQEPVSESDNVIVWLVAATTPIMDVIRWLQQHQLLKSEMKCDCCEHFMAWKTSNKAAKAWRDGFFWRCKNSNCPTFNCTKNIRMGSIFDKSKMCLKDWLRIIYRWSKNVGQSAASEEVNISRGTIANCYSFFREVCETYFKANPVKLGGIGITIEIEVFCFSSEYSKKQKRKPEGAEPHPPIWVLSIADTNCAPSIGYMEVVETKDAATLLPILLEVVQPGSIIHCKEWRAYREIQGHSEQSVNFVNADTSVQKAHIESYWKKHKSYLKAMRGTRKCNLNSYLQELMWHERFSDNALEILCEQIAVQYSDAPYIDNTEGSSLGEQIEKQKYNYLQVKLEENTIILEPPPKKGPRAQQRSHSIFKDNITSYIDNSEDSCSEEEMDCTNYLEVK